MKTPSPIYFATNPPKRRTVSATHFWYAEIISRISSGSIRAESAVEPTKSENITVTCRRSASLRGAGVVISGETGVCPVLSAATALNSLSLAPSGRPSSRRCSSVRSQSTSASIALSRNVCAYCSRPIPRSQPLMSKFSPLALVSSSF